MTTLGGGAGRPGIADSGARLSVGIATCTCPPGAVGQVGARLDGTQHLVAGPEDSIEEAELLEQELRAGRGPA